MAELSGKEAALFVCTGTMGNQLAFKCHLQPLQEVIVDARAHVYRNECGGISYHNGASVMPIQPSNNLYLTAADIAPKLVTSNNWHTPLTRVISLENTIAGVVHPIDEIAKIAALAKQHNLIMHLDGARIWNAMVATNTSLKEYSSYFDTVSICFSKGMGAPIGSILVGSKELIQKARFFRVCFIPIAITM